CLLVARRPSTATSPLSLHDALPISDHHQPAQRAVRPEANRQLLRLQGPSRQCDAAAAAGCARLCLPDAALAAGGGGEPADHRDRSEEHTSELQSRENLVCRLLLEKK